MRSWLLIVIFASVLGGCTGSRDAAPADATPAAAATPALIDIPSSPNQPGDELERAGEVARLDLDEVTRRGYIRVLVARSATHFYTYEGAHSGRTVDAGVALARALSEQAGKNVTPVFIETREPDLIPHLLAGRGDVAANLLLTFARDEQVAFAPPIRTGIRELVVSSASAPLVSLEDVGTRTIHVRKDSDHHASLLRLNEQLRKIDRPIARIELARQTVTDEQLLQRVNDGQIPATIVDDYVFERLRTRLPNVAVNRDIAVSQDGSLSWVSRKDAPKLTEFLKEFFSTHRLTF
jgi:membrane-bound lytic murein transglycosylase MltF